MQENLNPLDESEIEWLDEFLLNRVDEDIEPDGRDEGIIDVSEFDGLLTAVVSGPLTILPSRWLPVVWGDFEPVWESQKELERFMSLAVRHINGIVAALMEQPDEFEPMFYERKVDAGTIAIVDEWCEGYMSGVDLDVEAWDAAGDQIAELLAPIRAFTEAAGWPAHDLPSLQESNVLRNAIAPNVRAIHAYWLERRSESVGPPAPFRRADKVVGRDDPCPCGSGKKFKKCCLN